MKKITRLWSRSLCLFLGSMLLVPALALPGRAADQKEMNLDKMMRKEADEINKQLRERYLKGSTKSINVGVLKFMVKRAGESKFTDNAGPLNMAMANRLEVALVLTNPDEKVGIIERASEKVADSGNKRANHLKQSGRKEFFGIDYVLAWGNQDESVKADVFLTGEVIVQDNFQKVDVRILMFDKNSRDLEEMAKFTCWADPRTLYECGESVRIPEGAKGGFRDEDYKDTGDSAARAKKIKPEEAGFMWQSPVEVKIFYDGKEIEIKTEEGVGGRVPPPEEGQEVYFQLRNKSAARVGVVLMVNGESTIYREQGDPDYLFKWILNKGETIRIKGFQRVGEDSRAAKFKVLSPEQSAKDAVNYKEFAGMFSFAVYNELDDKGSGSTAVDDTGKAIARGALRGVGTPRPTSLQGLKTRLLDVEAKRSGSKGGLVVPDDKDNIVSPVEKVDFKTNVNSGLRGNIYYWTPTRN